MNSYTRINLVLSVMILTTPVTQTIANITQVQQQHLQQSWTAICEGIGELGATFMNRISLTTPEGNALQRLCAMYHEFFTIYAQGGDTSTVTSRVSQEELNAVINPIFYLRAIDTLEELCRDEKILTTGAQAIKKSGTTLLTFMHEASDQQKTQAMRREIQQFIDTADQQIQDLATTILNWLTACRSLLKNNSSLELELPPLVMPAAWQRMKTIIEQTYKAANAPEALAHQPVTTLLDAMAKTLDTRFKVTASKKNTAMQRFITQMRSHPWLYTGSVCVIVTGALIWHRWSRRRPVIALQPPDAPPSYAQAMGEPEGQEFVRDARNIQPESGLVIEPAVPVQRPILPQHPSPSPRSINNNSLLRPSPRCYCYLRRLGCCHASTPEPSFTLPNFSLPISIFQQRERSTSHSHNMVSIPRPQQQPVVSQPSERSGPGFSSLSNAFNNASTRAQQQKMPTLPGLSLGKSDK